MASFLAMVAARGLVGSRSNAGDAMPIDERIAQQIFAALRSQRVGPDDRELLFERVQEQMDTLGLDGDDEASVQAYVDRVRSGLGAQAGAVPSLRRGGGRSPQKLRPPPQDAHR